MTWSLDSRKRSVQCNLLHHYNMSTCDHLSLSSCTVIRLWEKYQAECSTVEPVALFLSLLLMVLTICVRLFLIRTSCSRSHLHTELTESCIKISAFLKSFAGFIILLPKKWLFWQLSVYRITNIMTVYKRVKGRAHDIIFKNSTGRVPCFATYILNGRNPLGPLMSFTYNIFPVIQSVNTSTFPWYLMWLLFLNKVGTGTERSW